LDSLIIVKNDKRASRLFGLAGVRAKITGMRVEPIPLILAILLSMICPMLILMFSDAVLTPDLMAVCLTFVAVKVTQGLRKIAA